MLSVLAGADIGSDADATPTAKGAEGKGAVPTAHGGRPARAAATPESREADVGAQPASLGPEVPRRLPPGVAAGRGARQQERDAGGPEEQSGPHDRRFFGACGLYSCPTLRIARDKAPAQSRNTRGLGLGYTCQVPYPRSVVSRKCVKCWCDDPLGKAKGIKSPTPGWRQQEEGLCSEGQDVPLCSQGACGRGCAYGHHCQGWGNSMQSWAGGNWEREPSRIPDTLGSQRAEGVSATP